MIFNQDYGAFYLGDNTCAIDFQIESEHSTAVPAQIESGHKNTLYQPRLNLDTKIRCASQLEAGHKKYAALARKKYQAERNNAGTAVPQVWERNNAGTAVPQVWERNVCNCLLPKQNPRNPGINTGDCAAIEWRGQ